MSRTQRNFVYRQSHETYYDFRVCQATPSVYIRWELKEEASDEDIMSCVAKSPSFSFLANPDEDIYTYNDGKPL